MEKDANLQAGDEWMKLQAGSDWNKLQALLKEIILKKDRFEEAQRLLHHMHSLVHAAVVYDGKGTTVMDGIWDGLSDTVFRIMPTIKDDTIAWNIWHITRIEDLTANFLITKQGQIWDEKWQERLGTDVCDTGNAMTDPEIIAFSNEINRDALFEYRNAVGYRTKEIIDNLKPEDMKRKVAKEELQKIADAHGVLDHPGSIWLLDFWGRKNVAGLFLMPITRHQIVHLNDCGRLKETCRKKKIL